MQYNNLCLNCFCEKKPNEVKCSKCGFSMAAYKPRGNCLAPGTLLYQNYIVGLPLGIGGFGITYKCFDISVGGICAVKEFMPNKAVYRGNGRSHIQVLAEKVGLFQYGIKRFREEAEILKQFNHQSIVNVYDSFAANGTAYYVMEYCDGVDFRRYTKGFTRTLTADEAMRYMRQMLEALKVIHSHGILHRDIAPDNIYITKNNHIKILDFGSARYEIEQNERNLSMIVKAGYAPVEQYGTSVKQGAYSDIYSLGATFYHLLAGKPPIQSIDRITNDTLVPIRKIRSDLPRRLTEAVDKAMAVQIRNRFENVDQMYKYIYEPSASIIVEPVPKPPVKAPKPKNISKQHKAPMSKITKQRWLAASIDLVIYGLLYFIIAATLLYFGKIISLAAGIVCVAAFPLFVFVMDCLFEISPLKATPGKCVCGIYVGDIYGRRISALKTLQRNILKFPGSISMLINGDKPMHDRITNSKIYFK